MIPLPHLFLALLSSIAFMIGAKPAHAETIPATNVKYCSLTSPIGCTGNSASFQCTGLSGMNALCGAVGGKYYADTNRCELGSCVYQSVALTGNENTCPPNQNWTLDGTNCTRPNCVGDQVRNDVGVCERPQCPSGQSRGAGDGDCKTQCPDAGEKGPATGEFYSLNSAGGGMEGNIDGCMYEFNDKVCTASNCWVTVGRVTGDAADDTAYSGGGGSTPSGSPGPGPVPSVPPVEPDDQETSCLRSGGCPIKINGNVTCSTCYKTTTVQKTSTVNPNNEVVVQRNVVDTTWYDNGLTESSSALSTTVKPAGSNSYTSGGAGAVTTSGGTTTTIGNQESYCQKNPADPACKNVAGSPTKSGDGDTKSDCEKNPSAAGCSELGAPENVDMTTTERGVSSITPVSFASNATCPAPIPLPHGASMSFQWICDGMGIIRPLILALAWLAAGLIVMGNFRNG
ncbi:hypothetical protein MASR1M60_19610 [Rhodocyclaceae bacterium]